jgi:hypothetical protein
VFYAVSKLRRPFLSDRYFFIAVRLLRRREKLTEPDFALLARAFNRLQRIRRHERRGIRQPTDGLIIDRVRMPSDPRAPI